MKSYELVQNILLALPHYAKVGSPLTDLEHVTENMIKSAGAKSCNKGYTGEADWLYKPKNPFPTNLVVNVNSVICHGHPTDYKIRDGDTICVDIGVEKDGLCGDGAITFGVGNVENKYKRLLRYTRQALEEGLKYIKAGQSLAEYGRIVEHYAALRGYVVVQTFASHGIGKKMHEAPIIPNYWTKERENMFFEEGKYYCLEPILTFKDVWGIRALPDEWAWITKDGRRSAMWEIQILVTKTGYINLMPELLKI